MGILNALVTATSSTLQDQWIDIIIPGQFDEHDAVVPAKMKNNGLFNGVITKGSKILVPENTAAFVFNQNAIETVVTTPGAYEYQDGVDSVFNGVDVETAVYEQAKNRFKYNGTAPVSHQIAYINLREIRNIRFGTRGPQVYNDKYYGVDLEVYAYGSFTVKVTDPVLFVRNFVPANVNYYSFDNDKVRMQLLAEFLQSFNVALNQLSKQYRISELPSQSNEISKAVMNDDYNAGSWPSRFGFEICKVAIENIEFSDESRELVRQYSSKKMNMKAYDDVSQNTSNIAAQQKIAEGIRDNGLGNAGGMVYGMNMAQNLSPTVEQKPKLSLDEQIESVKKLKELVDIGILTEEEFNQKKKEILGL